MRIEIQIEKLTLEGFTNFDHQLIAQAVEGELALLIVERNLPKRVMREGVIARLDGGDFNIRQETNHQMIGQQIAQAIYRGMNR